MVLVWFCKCLLSIYEEYSTGLGPGDREVLCSSEGLLAKKGWGEKQISLYDSGHILASVFDYSLVPNNRCFLTCKWSQFFSYALVFLAVNNLKTSDYQEFIILSSWSICCFIHLFVHPFNTNLLRILYRRCKNYSFPA